MTDTPGDPSAAAGFRLHTLGTLRLVGSDDDTVLGDRGHQRRRLALLAVLAASGERGRGRDQLLGLFWPDASQSRAQHSLGQLLYAIRTSLGADAFAGTNPIRLNDAVITSDIGDFADALRRGDLEAAAELYRGQFLDGFYLSDAPEFEQWIEAERARVAREYTEALETLAKRAEDAKDHSAAARWRRKMTDADPVSSKHAIGLIRALMNAGDHATALQYAERYEALVTQELGTGVGPAVASLVAEVRERAKTESVVVRGAQMTRPQAATPARESAPSRPNAAPTVSPPASVSQPEANRRAVVYGMVALVLLAVVAFGMWLRPRGGTLTATTPADRSIAVLPLANLSGDPRDVPFIDGLSEELIGVLAKIPDLRVIARTSAFVFKNSPMGARQIADSLHVSNILEGGVQKVGQNLRVQVRLIDARNGSTRWSETYDREAKDILLVQSDIAGAVARELHLRLGAGTARALRRKPTENIAAYELYLRGNDRTLLRSDSTARVALEYFRQAAALDPSYAGAFAGMARMYLRLRSSDFVGTSGAGNTKLAKEAALKSVALDDSLAEAHAAVGMVGLTGFDFATAERELKRAVALDPEHSRIREWLSFLYYWQERPADALAEANRAVENDPLSPTAHAEVARALCANGQVEQGLARLKSLSAVQPPPARVASYMAICYEKIGNWAAAEAAIRGGKANLAKALRAHALAHAGKRAAALAILTELTERWKRTNDGAFLIAVVHAGLGNRDQAFDWLDRSVREGYFVPQLSEPLLTDLGTDPRFQQFRKRVGI